jgi:O-Antigen ligase
MYAHERNSQVLELTLPLRSKLVPLAAGTIVLYAYIFSAQLWRTWYIAAAAALVLVVIATRLDGVVRATLPVVGYFALLLAGALWADFPRETVRWLIVDAAGSTVFVLFFLAARNSSPIAIAVAIASVIVPAVALAAFEYSLDPFTERLAGYSLPLLPLVIAFAAAGASMSRRKWPWMLAMIAAIALLLIGRSRAPLAAALLALGLSVVAFGTSRADRIRKGLAATATIAVLVLLVAIIPATRAPMLTTFIRITRMLPMSETTVASIENEIRATPYWSHIRPRDQVSRRTLIRERTLALMKEHLPLGIGYRNFAPHFEKTYGYRSALHSMYAVWLLEGGVAVFVFVAFFGSRVIAGVWRSREDPLAKAILISMAALMLLGTFHQVHQMPAFWLLLGMGAACSVSTRSRPEDFAR